MHSTLNKTKAKSLSTTRTVRQQSTQKAKSLPIIKHLSDSDTRQRFYKILLDEYKNTHLFVIILNVILVCEEIRPAYLLEFINDLYSDQEKKVIYKIPDIFKKIKPLVIAPDSTNANIFIFIKDSFVDKSILEDPKRMDYHQYVGEYLGFNCFDHADFGNYLQNRIYVSLDEKVTDVGYYSEVCEVSKTDINMLRKNVKAKNDRINALLIPLGYKSKYSVKEMAGYIERYTRLKEKDVKYVKKNTFEYINDLWNCYLKDDGRSSKNINSSLTKYIFKNVTKKDIEKLTQIYKLACIDQKFASLYEGTTSAKEKGAISKMLLRHDTEFWNGTRELEDIGSIKF